MLKFENCLEKMIWLILHKIKIHLFQLIFTFDRRYVQECKKSKQTEIDFILGKYIYTPKKENATEKKIRSLHFSKCVRRPIFKLLLYIYRCCPRFSLKFEDFCFFFEMLLSQPLRPEGFSYTIDTKK